MIRGFAVRDGCLCVGGLSLHQISALAGGAPFFAYDRALIAGRVAELRRHLPAWVGISYSLKANAMPALVQLMAGLVDGLDVSSIEELRRALSAGARREGIHFSGPGKGADEIAAAVAAGITTGVESPAQLAAVLAAPAAGRRRLLLRVNPDFSVGRSGMRMGGGPSPFGMDAEAIPALLEGIDPARAEVAGLHVFWGSQNLDAASIVEAWRGAVALALRLGRGAALHLQLGAGLGIPYSERQAPLDLAAVGAGLDEILREPRARRLAITLEMGRFLVGEAGLYVCRVLERKQSHGRVLLVTDGGMHHHLAATGNFGLARLASFPLAIGNRADAEAEEEVTIVGRLCTPLDRFTERAALPRAMPGDFVVVFQSGAYGCSASPGDFISHPPAHELLL